MTREWVIEDREGGKVAALKTVHDDGRLVQTAFAPATETAVNQWLADIQAEVARLLTERDAVVQQANAQVAALRTEEAGLRSLLEQVAPAAG